MGLFPAVHFSLDPETALAESVAHYRRFQIAYRVAMPMTLNAATARLHRVLNLMQGHIRQRLGLSLQRMIEEEWWLRQAQDEEAITQALGRVAWEARLEGLVVPSAAHPSVRGLVYFPDHKQPGSVLEIIHPEELPAHLP
jgi:RES domain-containing protein